MSDLSIQWNRKADGSEEPQKGPHPDYNKNLDLSKTFLKNVQKSLLNGMTVTISDASPAIKNCLLNIGWKAPSEDYPCKARFMTPLYMHKPKQEFEKEVETVFNSYIEMVKVLESKRPRLIQSDLLEKKA